MNSKFKFMLFMAVIGFVVGATVSDMAIVPVIGALAAASLAGFIR